MQAIEINDIRNQESECLSSHLHWLKSINTSIAGLHNSKTKLMFWILLNMDEKHMIHMSVMELADQCGIPYGTVVIIMKYLLSGTEDFQPFLIKRGNRNYYVNIENDATIYNISINNKFENKNIVVVKDECNYRPVTDENSLESVEPRKKLAFKMHKTWFMCIADSLYGISDDRLELLSWIFIYLDDDNKLLLNEAELSHKSGISVSTIRRVIFDMQLATKDSPAFLIKIDDCGLYCINPKIINQSEEINMQIIKTMDDNKKEFKLHAKWLYRILNLDCIKLHRTEQLQVFTYIMDTLRLLDSMYVNIGSIARHCDVDPAVISKVIRSLRTGTMHSPAFLVKKERGYCGVNPEIINISQ